MQQPLLSIIVPSYNESGNIPELARRITTLMRDVAWEMIVVDDDSPDKTYEVTKLLNDPRVRCIRRVGRRGLSGACIEGILSSSAQFVAVIDADLQHDENLLPAMLDKLTSDQADLVIATRNIEGGSNEGLSDFRKFVSNTGKKISSLILKADVSDPMSGFFMIRRALVESIAPKLATSGFKILADIIATLPNRPRISELAYSFRERFAGESKLTINVALEYLGFVLNKLSGGIIPLRFIFFALVGGVGVLVHLLFLTATRNYFTFSEANIIATFVAMTSNFVLNNRLTFRNQKLKGTAIWSGLLVFYIVCSLGVIASSGVSNFFFEGEYDWWLAGLAGALMSAVWNYAASSTFVWKK
jgi:dolichol-phosphate mannosyltransferase